MTEPAASSRTSRRGAAHRRRIRIAIAALILFVVLAVTGAFVVAGGGGSGPEAVGATPGTSTTTSVATPSAAAAPPPASIATTKGADLAVFEAPSSPNVVTTLTAQTDYLVPRTLLVVEQQGEWLKTLLPIRPNGSTGWVRASDVTLSRNPYKITVDLTDHEVTLYRDGQEILSTPAVIGSDRTPTPLGTFYVTDPVDLQKTPNGAYGAYALGLSGFSEVLFEFNGGPGQIAIHGTNQPQLVGQSLSNGCVRVPNEVIVEIARQAPLGTPVVIT